VKWLTPAYTKNSVSSSSAIRFGQRRGSQGIGAVYTSSRVAISRAQLTRIAGPATPMPRFT
jgi:hypothetical protein